MSATPQITMSGEDHLIARYFRPLARAPGAFGLSDDAAILEPPPGWDVVLKTDPIISGVHFFPDDPPDAVARKALRVNLSDLAAKGATPAGFLLALALLVATYSARAQQPPRPPIDPTLLPSFTTALHLDTNTK